MPRRTTDRQVAIRVSGVVFQGAPIIRSEEDVVLPADRIVPGEQVFQVQQDLFDLGLAGGDLLIVEPRTHAATGEFALATLHDRAFIGRWWTKHGTRKLMDNEFRVIADSPDLVVVGAVTLIARAETR